MISITLTHTLTPRVTKTSTEIITDTNTPVISITLTHTLTPRPTKTFTKTPTSTLTESFTKTITPTRTFTFTITETWTITPTRTNTIPTPIPSKTITKTWTSTFTFTITNTITETLTETPTFTITNTWTITPTPNLTPHYYYSNKDVFQAGFIIVDSVNGTKQIPRNYPDPVGLFVSLKSGSSNAVDVLTQTTTSYTQIIIVDYNGNSVDCSSEPATVHLMILRDYRGFPDVVATFTP